MSAFDIRGRQPAVERLVVDVSGLNIVIFHEAMDLKILRWTLEDVALRSLGGLCLIGSMGGLCLIGSLGGL